MENLAKRRCNMLPTATCACVMQILNPQTIYCSIVPLQCKSSFTFVGTLGQQIFLLLSLICGARGGNASEGPKRKLGIPWLDLYSGISRWKESTNFLCMFLSCLFSYLYSFLYVYFLGVCSARVKMAKVGGVYHQDQEKPGVCGTYERYAK